MKRALILWATLAWVSRVEARADFVLQTDDDGFRDSTAVQPVGGNTGSTRGEQRRQALAHALEIWGAALDSPVPIVVQATFPELSCTMQGAVLGQAYAWQYVHNLPDAPADLYYPSALADRIVGHDVSDGQPDLAIELNASIDGTDCEDIAGHWYYGFDGKGPSGTNDLIQVALHELAHGFGFASSIDPQTGMSQFASGVDVFTSHMLDLDANKRWDALTTAQRITSAGNVRRLVFDGENAQAAARGRLAMGAPSLALSPNPAGVVLARAVSDVELAVNPALSQGSGRLVLADPTDGCSGPLQGNYRGAVVLLENGPDCPWQDALEALANAGAAGAIFVVSAPASTPAEPLDAYGYGSAADVRAVTVSAATGTAINMAMGTAMTATLGGDPNAWLGADAQGRPLLFASQPALRGSSLSHFDSLARPNLLMEAYVQGGSNHDVDLTLAVLRDIGWAVSCGNGALDAGEQCDLGSKNSDALGSPCRSNCRLPGCGDGVKEGSEGCDDGANNSDIQGGACRTNCTPAHCGDGVMDPGEVCDQGIGNSDTKPDTCRTACTLPRCGDGVVDMNEGCDGTPGCAANCGGASASSSSGGSRADDAGIRPWSDAGETVDRHEGCSLGAAGGGWLALALLALRRRRRQS